MTGILNPNPGAVPVPLIRSLGPEHAGALMAMRHRAIRECAVHFGTPVEVELKRGLPYYHRQLLRYRAQGLAGLLGCWQQDLLTGMTGIRKSRLRGQSAGLIYSTFTEGPFRGQGIGRLLVEEARRQIHLRWRIERCFLHVEIHNDPALHLYQRCGFEITGKEEQAFWIDGVAHDVYVLETMANQK